VVVEPEASAGSGRGLVPSHHRLRADELRYAMAEAGLVEQSRKVVRPLFGSAVQTVYVKMGRVEPHISGPTRSTESGRMPM
jgi:hypothetical protein